MMHKGHGKRSVAVRDAEDKMDGSRKDAAEFLGISTRTLYRKLAERIKENR